MVKSLNQSLQRSKRPISGTFCYWDTERKFTTWGESLCPGACAMFPAAASAGLSDWSMGALEGRWESRSGLPVRPPVRQTSLNSTRGKLEHADVLPGSGCLASTWAHPPKWEEAARIEEKCSRKSGSQWSSRRSCTSSPEPCPASQGVTAFLQIER